MRNLPKILNFVKIIHYYSNLFTGVLTRDGRPLLAWGVQGPHEVLDVGHGVLEADGFVPVRESQAPDDVDPELEGRGSVLTLHTFGISVLRRTVQPHVDRNRLDFVLEGRKVPVVRVVRVLHHLKHKDIDSLSSEARSESKTVFPDVEPSIRPISSTSLLECRQEPCVHVEGSLHCMFVVHWKQVCQI